MRFEPDKLYHVYNQGNNHQPIFFTRGNYLYFLRKMRKQLEPVSDIFSYCLMPNHFHWLLYVKKTKNHSIHQIAPSDLMDKQHPPVNKIATLLRSYTQGIIIKKSGVVLFSVKRQRQLKLIQENMGGHASIIFIKTL